VGRHTERNQPDAGVDRTLSHDDEDPFMTAITLTSTGSTCDSMERTTATGSGRHQVRVVATVLLFAHLAAISAVALLF
jgi:hypothetical protein